MSVKDVNINSWMYYFLNDIINTKDFDLDNIKMYEK